MGDDRNASVVRKRIGVGLYCIVGNVGLAHFGLVRLPP
jgi:hypothetical protein